MLLNKSGFRVFTDFDLSATLDSQLKRAEDGIESDDKLQISGDEAEYISTQVEKYKIVPIELNVENLTVTTNQEMIPAEYFSQSFFVTEGESYPKEVFTFHLPFQGDPTLLKCVPSTRLLWTEEIALENNEIIFDVIDFSSNVDEIKKKRDEVINFLKQQSEHVNNQVNQYNSKLGELIKQMIATTNNKLTKRSEILSQLGTPLKVDSLNESVNKNTKQPVTQVKEKKTKKFDVFICHASEDKPFVNSLAEAIRNADLDVWYDDFQLGWGDDLRPTIDSGLKNSKFGIVVFSKSFLNKKKWTEYELNGLFANEKKGQKVILPVWHDITREDMLQCSPTLSDRIALQSDSIDEIVLNLQKLVIK